MEYVNPPAEAPQNVTHKTFYSKLYGHELGYNIYLPPDYDTSEINYPVFYHFHGWQDNESTDIWIMEKLYANREAITVFPNNSPVIETVDNLPVESMIISELIPYIDGQYRTDVKHRSVSGFSMGGGFAFYCAMKHPGLFTSVTAYGGTHHHYYHKEYRGVWKPVEKAAGFYEEMIRDERYLEENNVLSVIRQNAERIRGKLQIKIRIGTADGLICDNEIMHLYLDSLNIPHEYVVFEGIGHDLSGIL